MYRCMSPGYTPWPGVWRSKEKWAEEEGWTLQPFLPHSVRTPACIVGRCRVWLNAGSKTELTCCGWKGPFRKLPLDMRGKLLVGTVSKGARLRDREARLVIHDMVSEAPFPERLEEIVEITKHLPGIEVALPAEPHHPWVDRDRRGWPAIGWLVKRNDAPVRLTKEMVVSESLLQLDYYHVY